jgi:hypothetical protein
MLRCRPAVSSDTRECVVVRGMTLENRLNVPLRTCRSHLAAMGLHRPYDHPTGFSVIPVRLWLHPIGFYCTPFIHDKKIYCGPGAVVDSLVRGTSDAAIRSSKKAKGSAAKSPSIPGKLPAWRRLPRRVTAFIAAMYLGGAMRTTTRCRVHIDGDRILHWFLVGLAVLSCLNFVRLAVTGFGAA